MQCRILGLNQVNESLLHRGMSMRSCDREQESSWWKKSALPWGQVYRSKPARYWLNLGLCSIAMLTAFPASSVLSRLYYQDGGTKRWLVSWLAVAGWPLTALGLLPFYAAKEISPTPLTWQLFLSYSVLGFFSAADNLMFSWAYSYLPASTASLLSATSLIFTAIFAYLIVGKKLIPSTFNAVGVITLGAIILALDADSDKPAGVSNRQYGIGFILDIAGSALHGLIFALSELLFIKLLGRNSMHVVLEQQTMVSLLGCVFTTIGTIISGDFSEMKAESHHFHNGPVAYYMVLFWTAVTFQVGVLASVAVLYLASTLLAGVLNATRVPVSSIAAVIFLHDSMGGFKVVALLLTVWGFGSYIYGGFIQARNHQQSGIIRSSVEDNPAPLQLSFDD